eukprot:gene4066-5555_t
MPTSELVWMLGELDSVFHITGIEDKRETVLLPVIRTGYYRIRIEVSRTHGQTSRLEAIFEIVFTVMMDESQSLLNLFGVDLHGLDVAYLHVIEIIGAIRNREISSGKPSEKSPTNTSRMIE